MRVMCTNADKCICCVVCSAGFPGGANVKNPPANAGEVREESFSKRNCVCKFDVYFPKSYNQISGS